MKYLCLVYVEERTLNDLPKNERLALSEEAIAYCDQLQKVGQLLAASPDQHVWEIAWNPHWPISE